MEAGQEIESMPETFNLADISIFDIYENNPHHAGIIKNKSWTGASFSENLNSTEFSQIKQEVIQKITENSTEWEIREVPKIDLPSLGTEKKETTLLIHKSVLIKRSAYGAIEVELGKMHFKRGFNDEEWTKIEKLLKNKQKDGGKVAEAK